MTFDLDIDKVQAMISGVYREDMAVATGSALLSLFFSGIETNKRKLPTFFGLQDK